MSLAGKVAIVTGGSRGLGAGIAKELAARGAAVLITYVSRATAADQVVADIEAAGGKAASIRADCLDVEAPKIIVDAALQFDHGIDIVVNNAGCGDGMMLKDITYEHFEKVVNINMRFPLFLTQACLPFLRKGGRIVNIGSAAGRQPFEGTSVYGATKAVMESYARQWAFELGHEYGVTVNNVNPGPVATEMYLDESPPSFLAAMEEYSRKTLAAPRIGQVEDVVPIVAFLCEEQSRWVTGSTACANGGACFV